MPSEQFRYRSLISALSIRDQFAFWLVFHIYHLAIRTPKFGWSSRGGLIVFAVPYLLDTGLGRGTQWNKWIN